MFDFVAPVFLTTANTGELLALDSAKVAINPVLIGQTETKGKIREGRRIDYLIIIGILLNLSFQLRLNGTKARFS